MITIDEEAHGEPKAFERLLEQLPDGYLLLGSPSFELRAINGAAVTLLGLGSRPHPGRLRLGELLPELPAESLRALRRLPDAGGVHDFDLRLARATSNGEPRWVSVRASLFGDEALLLRLTDVSPRKKIEAELKHRNAMETLLAEVSGRFLDVAPDRLDATIDWALSQLGQFTDVDRCSLFQFSADRQRMTDTHEWCAAGVSPTIDQLRDFPVATAPWLTSQIFNGMTVNVSSVRRGLPTDARREKAKWDSEGVQSLLNVPIQRDERPVGVLGFDSIRREKVWSHEDMEVLKVVGDIFGSTIGRADRLRDLRRAKDAAEAAARAKSMFLAHMSHEIRTPLNGVIGMTSLVLASDLPPDLRDQVETIRVSADTLLSTINHILDFSRIDAGSVEVEELPFDVDGCVEDTLEVMAPVAARKGLELVYLGRRDSPAAVMGDAARTRQVLLNLVANAVKFTDGGEVTVEVEGSSRGESLVEVEFAIRDTGPGIPNERLEALFEPFSQLDASVTRRFGGTGLGLAICRGLCELMGGRIWAESTFGEGSVFHFTVVGEPAEAGGEIGVGPAALRLLLTTAHPTVAQGLASFAATAGIEAVSASSATEALAAFDDDTFDAVLIDAALPTPALELVAEIRKKVGDEAPPIVLMVDSDDLGPRGGEPVAARIAKPVRRQRLRDLLSRVVMGTDDGALKTAEPLREKRHLRVLLAEDVVVNQKVVLLMLEHLGHRADLAANGEEAVAAVRRQEYDVVLMDVQMPHMDGLEATRQIRQVLPADRQPQILGLTALATKDDRERCFAAGMDGYLSKPVELEELSTALLRSAAKHA